MSEFGDLLKEALTGAETTPPGRSAEALREAVAKFERRDRTVRGMAVFMVVAMTALAAWSAVSFFALPDDGALRPLLLRAVLFLFGLTGVSFGKLWFAMEHDHNAVMKEIKRTQLMLAERGGAG